MNILYVEDEAKIADFVCSGLKEQGFVVDYCDNGNDGYARTQILEHVWGYDFSPSTNVVDVCIQRIRKKIDPLADQGSIDSVRGGGYRFRQVES
jgi:DNA-binding response OmpR family regulator